MCSSRICKTCLCVQSKLSFFLDIVYGCFWVLYLFLQPRTKFYYSFSAVLSISSVENPHIMSTSNTMDRQTEALTFPNRFIIVCKEMLLRARICNVSSVHATIYSREWKVHTGHVVLRTTSVILWMRLTQETIITTCEREEFSERGINVSTI